MKTTDRNKYIISHHSKTPYLSLEDRIRISLKKVEKIIVERERLTYVKDKDKQNLGFYKRY
jgi:hypothetical protein